MSCRCGADGRHAPAVRAVLIPGAAAHSCIWQPGSGAPLPGPAAAAAANSSLSKMAAELFARSLGTARLWIAASGARWGAGLLGAVQ